MPKSEKSMPILIAGAGICGLASAIALSKIGRDVHIIEREPSLSAEGAGIQIGPNGSRILEELDVTDLLQEELVAPTHISIRHGWSGAPLTRLPIGQFSEAQFGAPYWVVHRAALQQALMLKVGSLPGIEISMGCEVTGVEDRGNWVRVHTKGTTIEDGSALIGADGLWSDVRAQLFPDARPKFSGLCAWRSVVPIESMPSLLRAEQIGLWVAPDAHIVHYPIDGGSAMNIVVILAGDWAEEHWGADSDGGELGKIFFRLVVSTSGGYQFNYRLAKMVVI